jgi:hypothetical protein
MGKTKRGHETGEAIQPADECRSTAVDVVRPRGNLGPDGRLRLDPRSPTASVAPSGSDLICSIVLRYLRHTLSPFIYPLREFQKLNFSSPSFIVQFRKGKFADVDPRGPASPLPTGGRFSPEAKFAAFLRPRHFPIPFRPRHRLSSKRFLARPKGKSR